MKTQNDRRERIVLPTGPTAPSGISPKHTAELDMPVHIPEMPAMKKLVRDTQFNRLIRGEIETTKLEIIDLEWLLNHKHTLKMEFVTKRGIQFTCTSCGHKITRSRRQLARMFKNA